jgi:hypothetical protein
VLDVVLNHHELLLLVFLAAQLALVEAKQCTCSLKANPCGSDDDHARALLDNVDSKIIQCNSLSHDLFTSFIIAVILNRYHSESRRTPRGAQELMKKLKSENHTPSLVALSSRSPNSFWNSVLPS